MVNNIVVDPVPEEELDMSQFDNTQQPEEQEQAPEDTYELPEKFKGKSVEEIIESYTSLEKELGRKGQEIGELRKLTQDFLTQQVNQQSEEQTADPVDFYDDPDKYIEEKIKNHPKLKEAEKLNEQREQELTVQKIHQQHPDAQEIVGSSDFQEWIQQSPVRQRLFQEANAYDFESANELLSTFKEHKMIAKTAATEADKQASKDKALKAGRTESRSSGDSIGGKPTYRSADLIRLMQTDPDRYQAMQPEIMAAYAEGRVK